MLDLTKENFDDTIEQHEIVVIDFWAKWCQPCLSFAKTYAKVASDYPNVKFCKVDVEDQPELPQDFAVASIPTLVIIKQQTVIFSESGSMPETVLRDLVDQALKVDLPQE